MVMVARSNGYYGVPFMEVPRSHSGISALPKMFIIVVYVVISHWLVIIVEEASGP